MYHFYHFRQKFSMRHCCGTENIISIPGPQSCLTGADPGNQFITDPAESEYYLDIFMVMVK
jgi:hypothetical protein